MEDKMKSLDVLVKADSKGGSPDESLGPVETFIENTTVPGCCMRLWRKRLLSGLLRLPPKSLQIFIVLQISNLYFCLVFRKKA